jgi:hypothetical protein
MYHFLLSPYNGPTKANYQHACIILAEGLQALNLTYTANIDYFPDCSGAYLFTKGTGEKAQYLITSAPEEFATEIEQKHGKKLIIIDTKDEWVRPKSAQFLSHAHKYFMSSAKLTTPVIKPYAFALSNRMIVALKDLTLPPLDPPPPVPKSDPDMPAPEPKPTPWSQRQKAIVWAHRVDNHSLRNTVKSFYDKSKIPLATFLDNFTKPASDEHLWNHTGRRHSPAYFSFLANHRYLDAHGGYPAGPSRINQWDSWKVWEGFLAGALVITADLDHYNVRLPHRLIPYEHYIPVRYDQLEASYAKLFRLPDAEQERIAKSGRDFVLAHYNPKAMAQYVISNDCQYEEETF